MNSVLVVVDDNRDGADTLAELGEAWGYDTRAVYDSPSALKAAEAFHPQIILLDIGLPGMDGYEVARQLRQDGAMKDVRMVAFTGYGSADDRLRASEAEFDHHLTKPVAPEALERLLARIWPAEAQAGAPDRTDARPPGRH